MKRGNRIGIVTCLLAAAFIAGGASAASAAVWAWGCQSQAGEQQVIFNRYSLFVTDGKQKFGSVHKLTADTIEDLVKKPNTEFSPADVNTGFEGPMTFTKVGEETNKLVLTEKTSKRTSHKSHLICGRDETTDIFRKVFRMERDGQPPRDITMQCIEYNLSTRGGRKGC